MSKMNESDLRRRLEQLARVQPSQETTRRATRRVRDVLMRTPERPNTRRANSWRIFTDGKANRRIAAVFIGAAALLTLGYLAISLDAAPVYAVTDVPDVLARATSLHASGRRYFPFDTMPDGSAIPPVPIELWVDLVKRRDRRTTSSVSGSQESVRVTVGEVIQDSQYIFRLNRDEKTAAFYLNTNQSQTESFVDRSIRLLLGDASDLTTSVRIGRERIEDRPCEIWQWERINQEGGSGFRTRFWFSPVTGRTERVQSWMKWSHTDWRLIEEYTQIELDVPIPEAVFAMEVPAGYQTRGAKDSPISTVPYMAPTGGYTDDRCDLSFGVAPSFTLSDGSVIWGWWSLDASSAARQDRFASLQFGGPLPELPMVFHALVPGGPPSGVMYWGRHLALVFRSSADGREIPLEWALYVPDSVPPDTVQEYDYDARYRFHLDHTPRSEIDLPVPYGRRIETAADFDRWVLPEIVGTAEVGEPPKELTFDGILQLAEQIRRSFPSRNPTAER